MRQLTDFANVYEVWGPSFANHQKVGSEEHQQQRKPKKRSKAREPAACTSLQDNQKVPDIMAAYLDDFMGPLTRQATRIDELEQPADTNLNTWPSHDFYEFVDQNHASRRKVYKEPSRACHTEEYQPEGVLSGHLAESSMAYDDYYAKQPGQGDQDDVCTQPEPERKFPVFEPFEEEEENSHAYTRTRSALEPLSPFVPPSSKQIYLEFVLYIFSGLVLIFILEHVLQMGMRMRHVT